MSTEGLPDVMTPAELMDWLKIKRTKMYDLIDQGLPYHSLSPGGRTKVFYRIEVRAWLDARGTSRQPVPAGESTPRRGRPPKAAQEGPRKWIRR